MSVLIDVKDPGICIEKTAGTLCSMCRKPLEVGDPIVDQYIKSRVTGELKYIELYHLICGQEWNDFIQMRSRCNATGVCRV